MTKEEPDSVLKLRLSSLLHLEQTSLVYRSSGSVHIKISHAEVPTRPPADPEMSEGATSSFQQISHAEVPTRPPADPEMSEGATSSFQQISHSEVPTQPPADPEMSEGATSSFQQIPSRTQHLKKVHPKIL
ncbi:proline-rich protein 36-like isoform X3 [Sphaeramia orbicularis]|uniref:proline-rich protein 36-like isoform X3 n=1 Tax=Sphaeramia orbicularis TaxID=375764 RepID=UPI00117F5705|nr:proline-rich protein 36-like isoform X3 [Sphaeramia orbicularis]